METIYNPIKFALIKMVKEFQIREIYYYYIHIFLLYLSTLYNIFKLSVCLFNSLYMIQ